MTKSITEERAFGIITAPFWKRLAAWLIDQAVLGAVIMILFFAFVGASSEVLENIEAFYIEISQVGILLNILYFTIFEGASNQTLGKRALGVFVYNEDGSKVGFVSSLFRRIGLVIPILSIIDAGAILFTSKNQRIFDILASTVVLKGKYREEGVRYLQGEDVTEDLVDRGLLVRATDSRGSQDKKILEKLKEMREELEERYEGGEIEKDQYLELKNKYDARIKALEENL